MTKSGAFPAPTWENQLTAARALPSDELRRHASVSQQNRHRCSDCFCCAAWEVLDERDKALCDRMAAPPSQL
jgi:hypothetical protein